MASDAPPRLRASDNVFERWPAMAASNINRVVLTGNLTSDPDLRETASGM